ncbi:hypothetical protein SS50377_25642 [Spironucleus salmonicida]|uniref:Uncharacterized protein n=1 Tax=Spironucleus salmonicida TaxID=348837 RepID=V6LXU3_9EUKA|nr:hypothetical protein SS50377_25642 [Spironucleus salmonicida]|eukprot:EST49457.1 Hypothetical protein SS50377_10206 [Spironucleus salmonicida]
MIHVNLTEQSMKEYGNYISKTVFKATDLLKTLVSCSVITFDTENQINIMLNEFQQLKNYTHLYEQLIRVCYFDHTIFDDISPEKIEKYEQIIDGNGIKISQLTDLLMQSFIDKQKHIREIRFKEKNIASYSSSAETATANSHQAMKEIETIALQGLKDLKLGLKVTTIELDKGETMTKKLQTEVDKAVDSGANAKKQTLVALKAIKMNKDCLFLSISIIILCCLILAFMLT